MTKAGERTAVKAEGAYGGAGYILKEAFDTLVYQGVRLKGILSRKKQIVPNIIEVMERL